MLSWFKHFRKKESPIEVLNNIHEPHLEESYGKFPRKKIKPISKERGEYHVRLDRPLLEKLQKKYGKEYTYIHTHPGGNFIPSPQDIMSFLAQENRKTSIIVPFLGREAAGYFVMKKNKDYSLSELEERNLVDSMEPFHQSSLQDAPEEMAKNLKKIANKYNFSYRYFPAKGFAISKEYQGFKNSKQPLETRLYIILPVLLSLYLLLNLSNITSNVTSGLPSAISNGIVPELLITCASLIVIIYLFRNSLTFHYFNRKAILKKILDKSN